MQLDILEDKDRSFEGVMFCCCFTWIWVAVIVVEEA